MANDKTVMYYVDAISEFLNTAAMVLVLVLKLGMIPAAIAIAIWAATW